jgi:hypothetical protein
VSDSASSQSDSDFGLNLGCGIPIASHPLTGSVVVQIVAEILLNLYAGCEGVEDPPASSVLAQIVMLAAPD